MASKNKIYYNAGAITNIEKLAKSLSFPESFLLKVSKNPNIFYTFFTKMVKNKQRNLADPHPALKILHKRIISRIFANLEFPPYLHGGIKTDDPRDFITNASTHAGAETTITLDIESFFPSITSEQVSHAFENLFNFSPEVSKILTGIVTLNGVIPQGAPTSSYIANFIMWEKECKLVAQLNGQGFLYTRLIDDMAISSNKRISEKNITSITNKVAAMLKNFDYKLHSKKKNIFSKSNPEKLMLVTGLWLNRGSPKILKERRIEISNEVIAVRKLALKPAMVFDKKYHEAHSSALGKVALLKRLKHARAERLQKLLKEVEPQFDEETCDKLSKLIKKFTKNDNKKNVRLSYLKQFYKFQYMVSIIKRTDPGLSQQLQSLLNERRPSKTMKDFHA